jgi:nicotinamide-nucleotide amidase
VVKLRTTGIFESQIAELIEPGLKLEPGVRLAYLPAYSGVDLRILAGADNELEAAEKAQKLVRYLEATVGKYIFGRDDDTLESVVGQLLLDNDKTLAVAESCTGGQLGMTLTSVPGASKYFLGGLIAYDNEVKINQLEVERGIIEEHGAVSESCAAAMALGCRKLFEADYALSITGIAGPEGGSEEKPVGTVFIGLASAHANRARHFRLGVKRDIIRTRAVYTAMEILRQEILDIK